MVLRVVLGLVFLPHGAQKALGWFQGHGLEATVAFFGQNLGLSPYLAYLVVAAEFLGAIALILGLFTRVAATGVLAVMVGAIFLVHGQNGFFMNWMGTQPGEGIEYHLLVMAIALVLLMRGGGRASLDHLLERW